MKMCNMSIQGNDIYGKAVLSLSAEKHERRSKIAHGLLSGAIYTMLWTIDNMPKMRNLTTDV